MFDFRSDIIASIAQLVERPSYTRMVPGSNPGTRTNNSFIYTTGRRFESYYVHLRLGSERTLYIFSLIYIVLLIQNGCRLASRSRDEGADIL